MRTVEAALGAISIATGFIVKLTSVIETFDQSILYKVFRGELVPKNLNEEPAADLLACIRDSREEAARKNIEEEKYR